MCLEEIICFLKTFLGSSNFVAVACTIANTIAAIIGIIISVKALRMSRLNIEQSNKQALFKERVESFVVFKTFYNLVAENFDKLELSKNDFEPPLDHFIYYDIQNTSIIGSLSTAAKYPDNLELRQQYLIKLEELKSNSERMRLLFDKFSDEMGNFVEIYTKFIRSFYGYEIMRNSHKSLKEFDEKKYRKDLIVSLEELKKIYQDVKKKGIIESVKNDIRLTIKDGNEL